MSELSMNFAKNLEDEEHSTLESYIQKHYYSTYDFDSMPELKVLQEMQLKLLRPPVEKEKEQDDQAGDGKKPDADNDQDEDDEDQDE